MSNGVCGHSRRTAPREESSSLITSADASGRCGLRTDALGGGQRPAADIQMDCAVLRDRNAGDPADRPRKASKHHRTPSIWIAAEDKKDNEKRPTHVHVRSEVPGHRRRTSSIDVISVPLETVDRMPPEMLETYERPEPEPHSADLHVEAIGFSDPRHPKMCSGQLKKPKAHTRPNSKRPLDENSAFQLCGSGFCPKCRCKVTLELGSQNTSRSKQSPKTLNEEGLKKTPKGLRVLRCAQCLFVISKVE